MIEKPELIQTGHIPSKIYFPDYALGIYLMTILENDGKKYQCKVMKN